MASHIERRKFLATLGGAAAWPLGARAQPVFTTVVSILDDSATRWVAAWLAYNPCPKR